MTCLLLLCCLFQAPETETVFAFLPEDQDETFTLEIRSTGNERRFSVVAESLRKNFGLNLVVEREADVVINGNFTDVTVNEFLTYVCRTYDLKWRQTGGIFQFYKEKVPAFQLSVEYASADDTLSIDARDVPLETLFRRIGEESAQNFVFDRNNGARVTGLIRALPLETALKALLKPYQLSLKQGDGFFEVVAANAVPEPTRPDPALANPNQPPKPAGMTFENDVFNGRLEAGGLGDAVRTVSRLARASVKYLDTLEGGAIAINFDNDPFERALDKLFLGTAYSYKKRDDIFLFGSKTRPELTSSEMIVLNHMNAQNVLAYLSGESNLFQTYALPARPSQFGSNTDADRRDLGEFSRNGNRANNRTDSRRAGVSNAGPTAGTSSAPLGGKQPERPIRREVTLAESEQAAITLVREHNALLVTATQDVISEIKSRLSWLDRPVPQVLIQALVVDFRTDNVTDLGLTVSNGANSFFPSLDLSLEGNREADGNFRITRLPSNFMVRIQALATEGKARIISKPHIATLSGHEAYIEVGETQSILLNSETLVGDETPVSQVTQRIETIEANISLRVIPWVTASGEITTYIEPVFNTFLGQVNNNVPPPISTRRLQSTVRLKHGETIILGGLIEEALRNNRQGVPGLSRIPWVGHLFKNINNNFTQSELVIYLTPYVYYGNEGSVTIIRDREGLDYPLDVREQQELIKTKKKPWWKRSKNRKQPKATEPAASAAEPQTQVVDEDE
ncbi:type II secretion system protein GspD [Acanthopleuribacter pedis]|uniref:Type II/III secretion system secretin-like domain-containing protein n=1 Tax=Acanthopleuribacter pedis TaxID=442870 RepID=A0A8J7QFB2_9BACT|nr:hypothetical protein [Acanthopleuribacter pedis]MBO1323029.1 hypothetical protein [Acanthopleuribacter pedis]